MLLCSSDICFLTFPNKKLRGLKRVFLSKQVRKNKKPEINSGFQQSLLSWALLDSNQ
jgi:hypothetical protein